MATNPIANNSMGPAPAPQVTEVYDKMRGFLKGTHWSKPYFSALHVNCTYLSTPGRAPTLLALKQHAQSLAYGDRPFAAEQAYDWLNDLQSHYHTEDAAHKRPLNALGPKWHCPLETKAIELPENHPFQQYRPYETHMTLLMHANEILERLDHEYSAMGGILGLIPLDSDNTTLVGQWILHTQHLVVRMHELEIAYGNSLDLLANEAIVPMQHISAHGPDDRWILANAGEDVFTFIHQMLDRAEAHQDSRDDVYAEQNVLGDAAFSTNGDAKYRGIVKADLNTRFYRLRGSGHGPLFVLPAFGDRSNTKHTRDIENRPTVSVNSWESKHKDIDVKVMRLTVDKSNLEARVSQLNSSVQMRDREIERLNEIQKQYDGKIENKDRDLAKRIRTLREGEERENALKEDIENYRKANIRAQSDQTPLGPFIRELQKALKEQEKKMENLQRDNDTLRILNNSPLGNLPVGGSGQQERQMLHQEIHTLKKSKAAKGKILNFPEGDSNSGITALSTAYYKSLLQAEEDRNSCLYKLDTSTQQGHALQAELDQCKTEGELLRWENQDLRRQVKANGKPTKIINIPWGLQHTSTFRDDSQGLIVLTTEWYDHLSAAELTIKDYQAQVADLQKQVTDAQNPSEARLSEVFISKIGSSHVYKDTERKIVISKLDHFEALQDADMAKKGYQQRLTESERNANNLQNQLKDVRDQLEKCLKSHSDATAELPNLQSRIDELQNQLEGSTSHSQQLQGQLNMMIANAPSDEDKARALKLQQQLDDCMKHRTEREGELKELQERHDRLRLNEHNLRTEVTSLRKQLSDAKKKEAAAATAAAKTPTTTGPASGQEGDELRALREEIKLYRSELETLQTLWNDLQTQHIVAQTARENAENAQRECEEEREALRQMSEEEKAALQQMCEEEKARLQQMIDDLNETNKILQMKLLADPNLLQPILIEVEAQRDAARRHRDELQQRVYELEHQ
ncbi:hypothetical protein GGR51DRAFT_552371 [Nemania sp. FL0031]|nr:hypothetical protein GGR51DRAFT_552371 [Nemania sp. FL0031]